MSGEKGRGKPLESIDVQERMPASGLHREVADVAQARPGGGRHP